MRNPSSQSKLLGASSASGKQSRVQHQKELRQAQRQQQNLQYATLSDADMHMHYQTSQAPRTVKNGQIRSSYASSQDSSNLAQPAGPSSTSNQRSTLQAARVKLMSQAGSSQPNLFGGLSRHVINASASTAANLTTKLRGTIDQGPSLRDTNNNFQMGTHSRGSGSTGYLLTKNSPISQFQSSGQALIVPRQSSQHNVAYSTVPTSPTNAQSFHNQPSGRTLAALENMNKSQQKLRKGILPSNLKKSQQSPKQDFISSQKGNAAKHFSFGSNASSNKHIQQQNQSQPAHLNREDEEEPSQMSSNISQPMPKPIPHSQFLSPQPASDSQNSNLTFAKRSSLIAAQITTDNNQLRLRSPTSNEISNQHVFNNFVDMGGDVSPVHPIIQAKGSISNENERSLDENPERVTTPELTTPVMQSEELATNCNIQLRGTQPQAPMQDASVSASLCCNSHEQSKQQAVLLQKVQFLTEQINEEKQKAKNKETQYNKIIAALKQTAEENLKASRKQERSQETTDLATAGPSNADWKDTLSDLNKKKEEVNSLQEKVLELELKAEKVALDTKIILQQKNDEVSEERLKLKHKESDLRQANATIERINEDIQGKIQESLDRQSERLATEKQNDLDSMNRRNEQLIKSLVESHSTETRQLRELLLTQERKTRDTEHQLNSLELNLQTLKIESQTRIDHEELQEIQEQNQQLAQLQIQTVTRKHEDETNQFKEIIVQLENHINQLQESKSEADRKLIIAEDKIGEVKKEVVKNKILVASQKEKEEKLQQTFKAQIVKERKTADLAVAKLKNVHKLEQDSNKKQILVNQLRAKISEMERDERHQTRILLMKRRQIEDEKTVLIKKQALRQRSMTKSNLSATRLQHQLQTKENVIQTERDSKKALLNEKVKLEKEIATIKRDRTGGGDSTRHNESQRHNESMSMYFARSQGMFSPRNTRGDTSTKSFIAAANRGHMTQRQQVFMSHQQLDRNQLYLSKQSSGERTSSVGGGSLQGGDSMVNIVEFEENTSPHSRRRRIENQSILSTPFKHDEPNESKLTNLQFKSNNLYSQSVITHTNQKDRNNSASQLKDEGSSRGVPIVSAGIAQYQTHLDGFQTDRKKSSGQQIKDNEAEFMQVLSQCDSENDSAEQHIIREVRKTQTFEKTPGMQLHQRGSGRQDLAAQCSSQQKKQTEREMKETQEIKLLQNSSSSKPVRNNNNSKKSSAPNKDFGQKRGSMTRQLTNEGIKNTKGSPTKLHLNMPSMMVEQRINDKKESFVRTVMTAREECKQFNNFIREKGEFALTTRQVPCTAPTATAPRQQQAIAATADQVMSETPRLHSASHENMSANNSNVRGSHQQFQSTQQQMQQVQQQIPPHANIRQMNRNRTQTQFQTVSGLRAKHSPISKTPLNHSNDIKELETKKRTVVTDATPEALPEPIQKNEDQQSYNGQVFQQLQNVTSSIGISGENVSEQEPMNNLLLEENNILKEQLDLVKMSLAAHQERATTTEMSMMDAIMQMKDQIQQVLIQKQGDQVEVKPRPQPLKKKHLTQKNEDYLVMSRNSTEDDNTGKKTGNRASVAMQRYGQESAEPMTVRKTNSVRQRSETFDLTQLQAESMYKKIKIKSPNKRAMQGSFNTNSTNFCKQTASSALKRQATQTQITKVASVSGFNQQQSQNQTTISNASFYTSHRNLQDRLSMGVLKQQASAAQQQSRKVQQSVVKNNIQQRPSQP